MVNRIVPTRLKWKPIVGFDNLKLEDSLMYSKLIVAGFLAFASSAHAQMSLDVSKVTCDQYVHNKIGNTRTLAAWFSGYYNAKRNNLVVDLQAVEAMADKVQRYCQIEDHWKVPVMQAIERLGANQ